MKRATHLFITAASIFLLVRGAAAQEEKKLDSREDPAAEVLQEQRGPIEFGFRTFWGNVYGRPDLPFRPDLATSKLNEYGNIVNNLYLRRARVYYDNILGSRNYVDFQSQNTIYTNQSNLAAIGQYGLYRAEFRYDEIPHIYSNTTRTIYTQTQPGVFTIPSIIKQSLQTASSTGTASQINNSLPSFVATQLVPSEAFIVPRIQRKAGAGILGYDVTPAWHIGF